MRLALLTNLTTSANLPVLSAVADDKNIELAHVYFYDTVSESKSSPLRIVRQFGLKKVLAKAWQMLSFKLRRKLAGWNAGRFWRTRYCYEYVQAQAIPHSITSDLNQQSCRDHLAALDVDVLLVCVCKNILKAPVLSIPRLAAVNIHPSKLPDYRGPMPVFWALLHREREIGLTIHLMAEQIDHGPILFQTTTPLSADETEAGVSERLFALAAENVASVLMRHQAGELDVQPQDPQEGSYQSYPTAADRRRFALRNRANNDSAMTVVSATDAAGSQ